MSRSTVIGTALGLLLGIALGLFIAWELDPLEYVDTAPASLRSDFKADLVSLIAAAYAGNGDLERAKARLALLPDMNTSGYLAALAQQRLAQDFPETETRALAQLASALGEGPAPASTSMTLPPPVTLSAAQPITPPSPTTFVTEIPPELALPNATPTPLSTETPEPSFGLISRVMICDPSLTDPLVQVQVHDSDGQPVPGLEILVIWDAGQDHFFTGLKPEIGPGYGDYTLARNVTYTFQLAGSDELVTGLMVESCIDEDSPPYLGSWLLTFKQPPPP